ncbi:ATP-binding protein [Achromobacter xylosoxidans]
MEQRTLLYDERFLESYAGAIITDPATAIVELVANCWDAYATEVNVSWPDASMERQFKISDNGHGMTRDEFQYIWRTIAYNRLSSGTATTVPPDDVLSAPRLVFGKNGKGRFASFCFASEYLITSRKDGQEFVCRVHRTATDPLVLEEISFRDTGVVGHGTEIVGNGVIPQFMFTAEKARELIGSRFLANPSFKVKLNGTEITFNDIPDLLSQSEVPVEGYGRAIILHIDTKKQIGRRSSMAWLGGCRGELSVSANGVVVTTSESLMAAHRRRNGSPLSSKQTTLMRMMQFRVIGVASRRKTMRG